MIALVAFLGVFLGLLLGVVLGFWVNLVLTRQGFLDERFVVDQVQLTSDDGEEHFVSVVLRTHVGTKVYTFRASERVVTELEPLLTVKPKIKIAKDIPGNTL